jgi:hypothetical protein
MNNAKIEILLRPVSSLNYSITFGEVNVRMTADFPLLDFGAKISPAPAIIKESIRNAFESAIRQSLNTDYMRKRIAGELRPTLDRQGIGQVKSVQLSRDSLSVGHFPTR